MARWGARDEGAATPCAAEAVEAVGRGVEVGAHVGDQRVAVLARQRVLEHLQGEPGKKPAVRLLSTRKQS